MAEPVGITGTALAVASLLYSSCRTVCDIIDQYKKAPKEYRDLSQDLRGLESVLESLKKSLHGVDDASLSQEQKETLRDLELPLKTCTTACDNFKMKLSSMTSHSTEDHAATRDRFRLHFNKSDVTFLREKLNTTKGTLQIAMSVSMLKTLAQNQATLAEFQETTATTLSEFTGKIEALALTIEALSVSGVTSSRSGAGGEDESDTSPPPPPAAQDDAAATTAAIEAVRKTLDEHSRLLQQCARFYASALGAANAAAPGTRVRHARAMEHARQVIGNLSGSAGGADGARPPPTVSVDTAEAGGSAFQGVGNMNFGGMSKEALDFLAGK